jgi:DNA-binding MarR family transcriptional regulator
MSKSLREFSKEVLGLLPYILRVSLRKQAGLMKEVGMTIPQMVTLHVLGMSGRMKMKDIAAELNISLPAASGIIDRMSRQKMLKRIQDEKDRRVINIELTDKGKKMLNQTVESRRSAIEQMFAKLTAEERETYLKILKRVKQAISEDE